MKKNFLVTISIFLLLPGGIRAEEFSLYGVKMGMLKEEIDTSWTLGEEGAYQIPDSLILNVGPEFDHRNRLYRLSFTVPIPLLDQYPSSYVATAFQRAVQELYGTADQIVSIRTGRGTADITITSKTLQDSYNDHIRTQILMQLPLIMNPPAPPQQTQ